MSLRTASAAKLLVCLSVVASRGAAAPQDEGGGQDLAELDLEALMEIEIDQVYGASLRLQRTLDAPSSVTVVTADEIRAHGYRTLAEILRSVTGMYVTDNRNYMFLGVRGFYLPGNYNARVLLTVDGQRLNDSVYGGFGLDFDAPVDPDIIERVEVIRGPGSALYGSSALLAVINVITKRGGEHAGVEGVAEVGTEETYLGRVTLAGERDDGLEWFVSTRIVSIGGDDLFYDNYAGTPSGGHTSGTDYENAYSLHARVDGDDWTLQSGYVWREKGIPTGSYGTVFDDSDNQTVDTVGFANLAWRPEVGDQRTAMLRAYYTDTRYRGRYIYDDTANGGPPDLTFRDSTVATTLGLDARGSQEDVLGGLVTLGGELRWNLDQDQEGGDTLYGTAYDDEHDTFEWAVFAQDEIALTQRTTLTAGARFDVYESIGGELSPRVALVHAPDDCTAYKLLYGQAFRAPNSYELYFASPQAANLDPEHIETIEVVAERSFDDGWRAAASLFHYEMNDLIAQVTDLSGALIFDNVDEVQADGIELEGEKRFAGNRRVRLSQSFQEVEDERTGDRLVNSPTHLTQLVAETPLWTDGLLAGLEVIYVGSRHTAAGDTTDGYVLTNLALRAPELFPGVEFALVARNLFDERYSDPVESDLVQDALEQDGFSLTLRLSVRR